MNIIKKVSRFIVAIVCLIIIWKLKWVLVASALVLYAINHLYKKRTGNDLALYTRLKGDK